MSQITPVSADLAALLAPQLALLAQAADRAELAAGAEGALRLLLPEHRATVIWRDEQQEPHTPDDAGLACIPLLAGDDVQGWLLLEPAGWGEDQSHWLRLLAAMLGPAAKALASFPGGGKREALREALGTVRRTRGLEPLLSDLTALIRASFPFQHLYWLMRYRASEWVHIVHGSLGETPGWPLVFVRLGSGLSGAVMSQGVPLYTDEYLTACHQRGVVPILDDRLGTARAWYGVPVRDGPDVVGAMVCFSPCSQDALAPDDRELLAWLVEECAHAILGAARYEQAAEQSRQREALNQIARQINRSLDPDDVPALIVERAPGLLNAEEASLLLLDEETGELVFRYAAGPAGMSLLGRRLPAGEGVAGFVASSGESTIVNDISADGRFYGELDGDSGFVTRSLVATPLRGVDGVRGVIEVLNHHDNAPFTDEDRVLLEALADQAVIALENARSFASKERALARRAQELDRSNDRLVKILQLSNALRAERPTAAIAEQIAQAAVASSGFRCALIALTRRGRGQEPTLLAVARAGCGTPAPSARLPLPRFHSLLRPELRRGSLAYLIERPPAEYLRLWGERPQPAPAGPGSWRPDDALVVLLRDSRGEISGILALDDPEDGNRPSPDQVQILEILANQAAAAFENATLYADQQHNLSRMMALNGLGRALSTTLRAPQQIYQLTASGLMEMSGARWAAVYLDVPHHDSRPSLLVGGPLANPSAVASAAHEALGGRRPLSRGSGGGAMLAIPLLGPSRSLGAICVGYADGLPDTGDVESMVLFASQAAAAVESLLLLGEVRLGRDQLRSILASTREGVLLVGDDGRVEVVNDAFFELAACGSWHTRPQAPAALAAIVTADLLWQWQAAACFPASEFALLSEGVAAVAEGDQSFVTGQLNGSLPGARSLEWSALRAARTGAAADSAGGAAPRSPILVTVRDITAAKETERLRTDLTNMMVHDLRSPLSSIVSSIDLIFRGVTGPVTTQQRRVLEIAQSSTQKLLNMISMLLDISRLESGRMPLEPAILRPAELCEAALEMLRVLADSRAVTLALECHEVHELRADRELILRVLQNLLDNALKFSPEGTEVRLSVGPCEQEPGFVRFAVQDRGVGIKPQDRELIFTKFGQAGNRRMAGTGLGLTFCKLVVEAHGGRIGVESEPGHGSCFFFTLPVGAA